MEETLRVIKSSLSQVKFEIDVCFLPFCGAAYRLRSELDKNKNEVEERKRKT